MREVLHPPVGACHRNVADDRFATLTLLGPSNRKTAMFADQPVLEIEVEGDCYLVTAKLMQLVLDRLKEGQ